MLVLPKSNATDKALIIEIDALAAHGDDRLWKSRVLDLKPVDLEVFGVRNDGVGSVAVHAVVEVVVELYDALDFDEPLQIPQFARLKAGAHAQRMCIRIAGESRLIDVFVAIATVEDELATFKSVLERGIRFGRNGAEGRACREKRCAGQSRTEEPLRRVAHVSCFD